MNLLLASFLLVGTALETTSAHAQQLRGNDDLDRQLQETVIVIPIIPILLLICCCCVLMNRNNEAAQQRSGPKPIAHTATTVSQPTGADLITVTATKSTPTQLVGGVFTNDHDGKIYIKTIKDKSLFANTALTPRMQVLTINNVAVQSVPQAVAEIRRAFPHVTILARRTTAVLESRNPYPQKKVVTAAITSTEQNEVSA